MATSRQARLSEKLLNEIYYLLPHLIIVTWHPMYDSALEYARALQDRLDAFILQLEKEKKEIEESTKTFDKKSK